MSNLAGLAFVLRCVAGGLVFAWLGSFVIGYQANSVRPFFFFLAVALYFVGWQLDRVDTEKQNITD